MALYHLHVKNISRSHSRSAVAAAAYRAGETLENAAEERLSKFAGRRDVLGAEIHLPADAPAWMTDRAVLWNAVEAAERRKDARLAKEVEFSIPRELPREAWFQLARAMAAHFIAQGFVVDMAVHDDGTGHNPHAHLMLATRTVTANGFGPKLRAADRKSFLKDTRAAWQTIANAALAKAGIAVRIDAGSYAARGIEREPGQRHAPDPAARRERREWVYDMSFTSRLYAQANRKLAADYAAKEGVRERFPVLSAGPEWPPVDEGKPTVLENAESRERKLFWEEARNDAAQQVAAYYERDIGPDRAASLDDDVNGLFQQVQAIGRKEGEERRQAFAENAAAYGRLFQKVNREMVRSGALRPENVRNWEAVSREFLKPDFDEMLAQARAIEAKRTEPDRTLRATPEQRTRLDQYERDQEAQRGVAFTPSTPVPPSDIPTPPFPAPNRPPMEQGQNKMIAEYHRPAPPDPFEYLARQAPQPARDQDREPAVSVPMPDRQTPPDPFDYLRQKVPLPPDDPQETEPVPDRSRVWERER